MSTLNKQIWTDQIMKGFYPTASFLNYVKDFSALSENDVINMADAGFDPNVLVNNTTYPIKITQRTDTPLSFELDLFETENTLVRNPEIVELSYDKMESVLYGHRMALQNKTALKAAHAYSPDEDNQFTPIVRTTGSDNGEGFKRLLVEDILKLKRKFDLMDIPVDKRYLVLDPRHTEDLILYDLKSFKDITDFVNGTPKRFAGFNILEFTKNPTYDNITGKKKAFGTVAGANDVFSSFAFCSDEVMKADGSMNMFERLNDPELRGTVVGFDKRFIALPIRKKGIGAIVSTKF
ncbi:hypothetical protein V3Q90_02080 [Flavobacterium oreochromis]|uniref:hypothetical protein n=1 Tax=Flavobacterium TaxID=237 RepID=UPI0007C1F54C|nr:hypothetical protein [Flavobacterium covae]AND63648.1 hypothetical protein AX766_04105 [Flavobacterium covae]AND63665.1 hypothetical protein AX766_04195 [Flavobacterium covae]